MHCPREPSLGFNVVFTKYYKCKKYSKLKMYFYQCTQQRGELQPFNERDPPLSNVSA